MPENLIDVYLGEQQDLTAVEKFALQHDLQQLPGVQPFYKELIPKKTPGPGEQYAFEVNLDQCSGCKACITACHNENGLEEDETWRSVGLIHGGTTQQPVIQHVTSACHHCLDPACMNGCPVNAYEKDTKTGVVKHLEDQCIGCQYCIFTCSYNVPQYNKKKGIVHKCDMCISRLEVGEAPACARACPGQAIRITLVETAAVKRNPDDYVKIPGAPDSRYTLPTTRYLSKKELPINMVSADFGSIKPEHSHWPLIVMLILTELSVGAFGAVLFLNQYIGENLRQNLIPYHVLIAFGVSLLALGASVFHLGRPRYAFRAVVGLRKSWLSREIVAFGIFVLLSTIYAFSYWLNPMKNWVDHWMGNKIILGHNVDILGVLSAFWGIVGIFCSVMVYKKTKRPFWDHPATSLKFFMTTIILGAATIFATSLIFSQIFLNSTKIPVIEGFGKMFCFIILATTTLKLILESTIFVHLNDPQLSSLKKTVLLMTRTFQSATVGRFVCGVLGGILFPLAFWVLHLELDSTAMACLAVLIFGLSLTGEILERYLFFRAVVSLKMPGGTVA